MRQYMIHKFLDNPGKVSNEEKFGNI